MKKLTVLFFVFVLVSTAFSQRSGFMGKHFSLNTNFIVYPSLYHPVANDQPAYAYFTQPSWFGFNYRLNINLDAIVSKKSTVGFDFNYYHSAAGIDTQTVGGSGNYFVTREFDGYAIGVHYRVFLGNTKAPVGFYYKVETGSTFYTMDNVTVPGNFYVTNYFGRQHVFFGRMTLNYGLSLGLVMPSLYTAYSPPFDNFATRLTEAGNLRSLWHWGLNFYGGVGVLLF